MTAARVAAGGRLPPPEVDLQTSNLHHLFSWLDQGDCVVLHTKWKRETALIYHRCGYAATSLLDKIRVIFFEVVPSNQNPWPSLMQNGGYEPCSCQRARDILDSDPLHLPNVFAYE